MASDKYLIRGGVEGRERLRLLSEVLAPTTRALLAQVGVSAGSRCLDVGCGGGDVTFDLARAAGRKGQVLGVDFDETKLEMARAEARERKLANVTFEVHDVTTWEPDGLFDIVYARFLLTHLREPRALVTTLRRHLRPGGAMIFEDIDYRGHFSEPDCRALRRSVELYTKAAQRRGADPHIGPRLPVLMRESGIGNVQMKLVQPAALEGGIKLLSCVTLENIAEAVVRDRLATEAELHEMIEELYAFARDPQTIIGGPRVFQVWSRDGSEAGRGVAGKARAKN